MKVSVDLDVKLDMFTCGTLSKDDKSSTLSLLCGALVNMYKVSSPCGHPGNRTHYPGVGSTMLYQRSHRGPRDKLLDFF